MAPHWGEHLTGRERVAPAAAVLVLLVLVLALSACATPLVAKPSRAVDAPLTKATKPLPTNTQFDYQLGGGYIPPTGVTIVSRDSTDKPAAGMYNICYVNGFQTQDYQKSYWLKHHPSLVLHYKSGKIMTDPGWPGEMIIDSSTAAKRTAIAAIMAKTTKGCATHGFDAVEYDNLDSYTRSHSKLTKSDNIKLATLYVKSAHADGLAAGQKNTTELGSAGKKTIHYDFAVAEECYKYHECAAYTKVYGAAVLDIEYTDDLRGTFASDCASTKRPAMMILRDRDLTTPASKNYVYQACPIG
jgi:hypothetical protein